MAPFIDHIVRFEGFLADREIDNEKKDIKL